MAGSQSRTVFRNILAFPDAATMTGAATEVLKVGSLCKRNSSGNFSMTDAQADGKASIFVATAMPGAGKTIDDDYAVNEAMTAVRALPGYQADLIFSGTGTLAAGSDLAVDTGSNQGKVKVAASGDTVIARTVEGYTSLAANDRVWAEFVSVGPAK